MGVIEEIPEKGIVKYAKPAGVIASLIPVTSPYVTPIGIAIYAIKCKDAVIFSPHPASRKTTIETVRVMRAALRQLGAPEDLAAVRRASPASRWRNELMAVCDLTIATGGPAMVKAAYGSGKPAYGVGAGNATMVIDETADVEEAARNTAHQQDQRQRLGLFRRRQPRSSTRRSTTRSSTQLQAEGGYLVKARENELLQARLLGRRRAPHGRHDRAARRDGRRESPGSRIPADKTFLIVEEDAHRQGASVLDREARRRAGRLQVSRLRQALDMVRQIFETGGRGHSCGIYSFDDDHIHRLALMAPVSRIMVRQVQSSSNAGTFTNGMPMTSSMGCGVWGGNITNENISLKHYMNVTWVSRPIPEDRPSEQELFGEFYNSEIF